MTIREAIKKAKDNGFKQGQRTTNGCVLSPLFWQCLGKSLKWTDSKVEMSDEQENHKFMGGNLHYPYNEGASMIYTVETWKWHWHKFIDHLSEDKTIESFFETL